MRGVLILETGEPLAVLEAGSWKGGSSLEFEVDVRTAVERLNVRPQRMVGDGPQVSETPLFVVSGSAHGQRLLRLAYGAAVRRGDEPEYFDSAARRLRAAVERALSA